MTRDIFDRTESTMLNIWEKLSYKVWKTAIWKDAYTEN